MNPTTFLASLAALVFLGLLFEAVFRRTGIPDVLFLLGIGLVISMAGLFHVEDLKGLDKIFTTAALVLILFDGAVRMRLSELRKALASSVLITVLTFFTSIVGIGLLAWALFGMKPLAAAIMGAILAGTSGAVVIPTVQLLKIRAETKTVLSLESALSDVLTIVTVLALMSAATAGDVSWGQVGTDFLLGFFGAIAIGAVTGVGWAFGMRAIRQKRSSILVVGAAVFLVYALAQGLGTFGPIACLAFGLVLGNAPELARGRTAGAEDLGLTLAESNFMTEAAFLLKVLFFVYLGAALRLDGYQPFVFGGLATLALLALRAPVVRLSFRPSQTLRKDAIIAAVLVPRGLAAAILAGLVAQSGLPEGATMEAVTFGVVLFSIPMAATLAMFADKGFVTKAYARVLRGYQEEAPEASAEPTALPAERSAEPSAHPGVDTSERAKVG
jgi:potassium/hydrogen antiporter